MSENARVISESAFRHRVREAAYFRSLKRQHLGAYLASGNGATSDWQWAEQHERSFLNGFNIWVVPDEYFDCLVRVVAHKLWQERRNSTWKEVWKFADKELREQQGIRPSEQELVERTRQIHSAMEPGLARVDWVRARDYVSGRLDVRGQWDVLRFVGFEPTTVIVIRERAA